MITSGITLYPYYSLSINLRDLLVILPVFTVIVVLQTILSRREKWWPGLILPVFWLLWTVAGIAPDIILCLSDVEGLFESVSVFDFDHLSVLGMGLLVVLVENIPNLLLLAIYAACHTLRRHKRKKQLKKTRIDDL